MDTLYIGEIPKEYHFAKFGNGYIDLFNTDTLNNNTYNYYRVFTNVDGFYYSYNTITYSQYNIDFATSINVTDNIQYRTDFPNIMLMTFIFVLFGIFLFNIITSIIRKGGVLGGLL